MPKKFFKVDLIPALRRLEILSRGLTSSKLVGAYRSVFKGKGLEFKEYREYTPADDSNLIDWKASAKTNEILMKEYSEEREVDVFFLVDCSSKMLFGSTQRLKAEYAIELVASLSHAILEAGDSVGLALYSDKLKADLLPSRGKTQFYNLSKVLLNIDYYEGNNFNIRDATKFIFNFLKKRAVVIIVSDFINWKEEWEESLSLLSQKFDVVCIMVRDPRDRIMPEDVGEIVLQDPNTGKTLLIEPGLIKQAYEHDVKEQEIRIKKSLFKIGIDFADVSTDKSFVKPIINLFLKRALRWR
ncbi:MAG: DUF58 domain-containing protein [Nanoarchaeota archaeon]